MVFQPEDLYTQVSICCLEMPIAWMGARMFKVKAARCRRSGPPVRCRMGTALRSVGTVRKSLSTKTSSPGEKGWTSGTRKWSFFPEPPPVVLPPPGNSSLSCWESPQRHECQSSCWRDALQFWAFLEQKLVKNAKKKVPKMTVANFDLWGSLTPQVVSPDATCLGRWRSPEPPLRLNGWAPEIPGMLSVREANC